MTHVNQPVDHPYEDSAGDFLELASEQRLAIIQKLLVKKSKLSLLAKELDATPPEVFRNLERLEKAGMIMKNASGEYNLTICGHIICTSLIPSLGFISRNKTFFKDHDFGEIPQKFIQRIGALTSGELVSGFTRVIEKWQDIFENSNEYISGILVEEPLEVIEPLIKKAKKGIKVNSIFSESAIIPKRRTEILQNLGVEKLIQDGVIERKMKKDVKVVVVLNEKEACVNFPTKKGEPDISKMFYSTDPLFHEWCLDYFRYWWYDSEYFQESKLKK